MTDSSAPTDVREALAMAREALDKIVSNLNYLNVPQRVRRAESIAREAQSRLAALPAPAPAEAGDWKLVPVEPTPEMMRVAVDKALTVALSSNYRWPEYVRDLYLTMLAAAPAHPSPDGALREALREIATLVYSRGGRVRFSTDNAAKEIYRILAALSLKEPAGHE